MAVTARADATPLADGPRLAAVLARDGLEAVLAAGFENLVYLTGYGSPANWFLRETRLYALAVPAAGTIRTSVVLPISLVSHYLEFGADGLALHPYGHVPLYAANGLPPLEERLAAVVRETPFRDVAGALRAALAERGLTRGRIGLDTGSLTLEAHQELAAACPELTFVPATALLREIRAVKTAEELGRLRAAADIAHRAVIASVKTAREGMTERDLARLYEHHVVAQGGRPTFTCIGFGERGAYSNVTPSRRALRPGDLIRYDVGCAYEFYQCDIARTFAFGRATPEARDRYRATLAGERAAIAAAVPGAPAYQVFTAGVEGVRRAGLVDYERTHCGHAIGLEIYEPPLLAPGNETSLAPGMVLAIETPYYELGTGGFQPEDIVLVTERGPEVLTTPDDELVVIG